MNRRRKIAHFYDEQFGRNTHIGIFQRNYDEIVPFMYIIKVDAHHRDNLIAYLTGRGIHAGLRYFPCHMQPGFRQAGTNLPVTEKIQSQVLSIPIYSDLSLSEAEEVAEAVQQFFSG